MDHSIVERLIKSNTKAQAEIVAGEPRIALAILEEQLNILIDYKSNNPPQIPDISLGGAVVRKPPELI